MFTNNYTITTSSGTAEQILRIENHVSGDTYSNLYEPYVFIVYVSGSHNVKIKFLYKGEDESLSTGIYCIAGNEYNLAFDGNKIYKVIVESVTGDSAIILSCIKYSKSSENYNYGIITE